MGDAPRHLCPICGRDALPRGTEGSAYPFCSPQCKLVDLGRWLDGAYAIPGPPVAAPTSSETRDEGDS